MNGVSLRCTAAASILAFASTAKLMALYHQDTWILADQFQLVVAVGELTIAIGLVGWPRVWWGIGVFGFVALAMYATRLAVEGRSSCGCFGAILSVSPHILVLVDLICATLLLSFGSQSNSSREKRAFWHPAMICTTACVAAFVTSILIRNLSAWSP